jgi:hypothetical protein
VDADPRVLAQARGIVRESARACGGDLQAWLESLIGFPHQAQETRADLVSRTYTDELRAIWAAVKDES